ncbi:D-glycerate dehydrogenase [Cytobacillus depressus]|uniref:D-glycerate dehydrogenase n=1 Tax=Cytobacillus depressus TaxID=1602942 RepID=A0A6L3VES4_9BACI|nr:D-glycerate dehydrogenase [Cytobacillus depressus]KAB2338947.1 D-glycerate dehydrogenase [Cytobacillus depressus]
MKKKVFITRKPPEHVLKYLQERFIVDYWDEEDIEIPRKELVNKVPQTDGLLCLLTEKIDEEVLENGTNLKVISNLAVGYNNIELEKATSREIMVTNTPGVLTETTADLTFALLLATSRRLIEASNSLREGNWQTWSPMYMTGMDVYGSTLGIIGLGEIGAAVARRAKGFNMKLLYNSRNPKPDLEAELDIEYTDLDTLLQTSDFVCILTPLTQETKNFITLKQLKKMKKSAVLVNTARGGIVNEADLIQALSEGDIWGAGLDVFEQEPIDVNHPLLQFPNVVTLPHIGSASIQTRTKMWELAAKNLTEALEGKIPSNLVNRELGSLKK